jgi:hypothetical protein
MHLVPAIKSVKELGLFATWENKFQRKNTYLKDY